MIVAPFPTRLQPSRGSAHPNPPASRDQSSHFAYAHTAIRPTPSRLMHRSTITNHRSAIHGIVPHCFSRAPGRHQRWQLAPRVGARASECPHLQLPSSWAHDFASPNGPKMPQIGQKQLSARQFAVLRSRSPHWEKVSECRQKGIPCPGSQMNGFERHLNPARRSAILPRPAGACGSVSPPAAAAGQSPAPAVYSRSAQPRLDSPHAGLGVPPAANRLTMQAPRKQPPLQADG
jgi:hypothetical protein